LTKSSEKKLGDFQDGSCRPGHDPANAAEFWLVAQRYLSADSLADRQRKINQLLLRQLKMPSRSFERLLPQQRDMYFNLIYGSSPCEPIDVLLNVLLALEDLQRYRPETEITAFAIDHLPAEKAQLISALVDSPLKSTWVAQALQQVPNWSRLRSAGPWLDDSRGKFLSLCLSTFSANCPDLTADVVRANQKIFRQLLSRERRNLPGNFLPKQVLLVEGPTEAIVLPQLCRQLGFDFGTHAIQILPCGGSKQVRRRYELLRRTLTLPITILLDGDAAELAATFELSACDRLLLLNAGEFEDIFDQESFIGFVESYMQEQRLANPLQPGDWQDDERRTQLLDRLCRVRGLGDFDKIALARVIAGSELPPHKIPTEIKALVQILGRKQS